jgi:hypothetical protein
MLHAKPGRGRVSVDPVLGCKPRNPTELPNPSNNDQHRKSINQNINKLCLRRLEGSDFVFAHRGTLAFHPSAEKVAESQFIWRDDGVYTEVPPA